MHVKELMRLFFRRSEVRSQVLSVSRSMSMGASSGSLSGKLHFFLCSWVSSSSTSILSRLMCQISARLEMSAAVHLRQASAPSYDGLDYIFRMSAPAGYVLWGTTNNWEKCLCRALTLLSISCASTMFSSSCSISLILSNRSICSFTSGWDEELFRKADMGFYLWPLILWAVFGY